MTTMYRLKIALVQPYHPMTKLVRVLDVSENIHLNELAEQVTTAFGYEWQSDFRFLLAEQKIDNLSVLTQNCKTIYEFDSNTSINDNQHNPSLTETKLAEKSYFYYQLHGDNTLLHRIRIEKIFTIKQEHLPTQYLAEVTSSVGELPSDVQSLQKEQANKQKNNAVNQEDAVSQDIDMQATLLSALMLIAHGNPPVRWQELVFNGIADEMVRLNLIKPCVNPEHIVRLTAYGEHELVMFLDSLPKKPPTYH